MHSEFWWEKHLGIQPCGRTRRIWEDNIMIDLGEMSCEDWRKMELAWDHV
jgi:hypothetical protein